MRGCRLSAPLTAPDGPEVNVSLQGPLIEDGSGPAVGAGGHGPHAGIGETLMDPDQAGGQSTGTWLRRGRRGFAAIALAAMGLGAGVTPAGAQTVYTSDQAPLYAGPAVEYPLVGMVGVGAPVAVQGCVSDWTWCDVRIDHLRGWMPAHYLDYVQDDGRWTLLGDGYQFGFPIVSFSLGPYWDRHYRGSAWYGQRGYWGAQPAPVFVAPPVHAYPHRPWGPPAYHPAPPVRPYPVPVPVRPVPGPGFGPGPGYGHPHGPSYGPGPHPGGGGWVGNRPGGGSGRPGWQGDGGGRPGGGTQVGRPTPAPIFQPPAQQPRPPGPPTTGPGGSFRQGEPFGGRGGAPHQGLR